MTVHVGDTGTADGSLHPQGVVRVFGKRFPARAEHGSLAAGDPVVVVGGDNNGLVVRRAEPGQPLGGLPRFGEAVHASFLDRLGDQDKRADAEQTADRTSRRSRFLRAAAGVGAAAAVAVLQGVWSSVTEADGPTWQAVVFALFGGAGWGALVFLNLAEALKRFDGGDGYITAACTALALAGGAGGAAVGIPAFGLVGGLSLAVVGTLTCGLILPLLMVVGEQVGPSA
jgi:hypothetical protein